MKKIVTFGEIMLRLAPENYLRFVQSEKIGNDIRRERRRTWR